MLFNNLVRDFFTRSSQTIWHIYDGVFFVIFSLSMLNPVFPKFVTSARDPIGTCELNKLPPDPRQTSGNRTLTSHELSLNTETEKLHDVHKELAGVAHGQME